MSAHWSLGVLVWLPVFALVVLAALGFGAFMIRVGLSAPRASADRDLIGFGWLAIGVGVVLTLILLSPLGYYPYSAEYHQWRPVSGTVTQVSSRIVSDGSKSVNQRFVVKIQGRDQFYGCDDTRCSTLKVGETVHLSCKREWQYASVPGYGCRWAS